MNTSKKRLVSLVFLSLILFSIVFPAVLAAENTPLDNLIKFFKDLTINKFGDKPSDVIVSLIITLVIFAGLYDILELISIFQLTWVKLVIAGCITLIGVIYQVPLFIMVWGGTIAASLGAFGIILEILVSIVIFIFLIIGNNWFAKFAARRKGAVEEIKAIKSADQAAAAITGLKRFQRKTT